MLRIIGNTLFSLTNNSAFASLLQVAVMQKELTDLQPELIKTSAETDKLMVKIEQDTVEVEAKKEVCCQLQCS